MLYPIKLYERDLLIKTTGWCVKQWNEGGDIKVHSRELGWTSK